MASNTGDLFIEINMSKENKEDIVYRKCKYCGKEFIPRRNNNIYCSFECKTKAGHEAYYKNNTEKCKESSRVYRAAHKEKKIAVCVICGKTFESKKVTALYCSEHCRTEARKRRDMGENKEKVLERRRNYILKNKDKIKTRNKEYYEKNKESIIKAKRRYYAENRETILEKKKLYQEVNKEKIAKRKKIRYEKNKEAIIEECRNYRRNNKDKINLYKERTRDKRNLYRRDRFKNDPEYRLRRKCRGFIHRCIENKKVYKTFHILGYTPSDLKNRLESLFYDNMSWDNYSEWEIHHIRPLETFNFIKEDGTDNYDVIREANSLNNLIPLFIEDHKKLTFLYSSEKKWLSEEEIKEFITRGKIC